MGLWGAGDDTEMAETVSLRAWCRQQILSAAPSATRHSTSATLGRCWCTITTNSPLARRLPLTELPKTTRHRCAMWCRSDAAAGARHKRKPYRCSICEPRCASYRCQFCSTPALKVERAAVDCTAGSAHGTVLKLAPFATGSTGQPQSRAFRKWTCVERAFVGRGYPGRECPWAFAHLQKAHV